MAAAKYEDISEAIQELLDVRRQDLTNLIDMEKYLQGLQAKTEEPDISDEERAERIQGLEADIQKFKDSLEKLDTELADLAAGKLPVKQEGDTPSMMGASYKIDITQPRFLKLLDRITDDNHRKEYSEGLTLVSSSKATGQNRAAFYSLYTFLEGLYPARIDDSKPRETLFDEVHMEAIAAAAKSATLDVLSSPRGEVFAEYKLNRAMGTRSQITRDIQERFTALLGKRVFGSDQESEVSCDVLIAAVNECQNEFNLNLLGTLRLLRTATVNMALSLCNDALKRYHEAPETVDLDNLVESFRSLSFHGTTQSELRAQLHAIKFKARFDKTVANVTWIYSTIRTLHQDQTEQKIALVAVDELSDWFSIVFQRENSLHSLGYAIRYAGPTATREVLITKIINFVKSQFPPLVPDSFRPGNHARVSHVTTGQTPATFALPGPNVNGTLQYATQAPQLAGQVAQPNQPMPTEQQLQYFWQAAQQAMVKGNQQPPGQQQQTGHQGRQFNNNGNQNQGNGPQGTGGQGGQTNGNSHPTNVPQNKPAHYHQGCFKCGVKDHRAPACPTYGGNRVDYTNPSNQCGKCGSYHPSFPCMSPIAQAGYGDGSVPSHPRVDSQPTQPPQQHRVSAMSISRPAPNAENPIA